VRQSVEHRMNKIRHQRRIFVVPPSVPAGGKAVLDVGISKVERVADNQYLPEEWRTGLSAYCNHCRDLLYCEQVQASSYAVTYPNTVW
jgi:hypothetical protein